MQHSACCSPHLLQSSFYCGIFFPSAFYAEIQGARAPEHLVLSQNPAAGFFWIAGTLTNSRLMLDEKYNLHCWLSPVTDTWRGFEWNFVLKKILAWKLILHCVDVPGKAEPALLALRCVLTSRNISWNKSPCPPPSEALQGCQRGHQWESWNVFLMHLESPTQCCTRSAHICSHSNAGL